MVLIGETADSSRYVEWMKTGEDLSRKRRSLFWTEPAADPGEAAAQLSAHDTVCGCLGVSKENIIQAIHEDDCVDLFVMTSPTQDDGGHYKAGGGLYFNFRAKHGKNGLEWQTKSEYYEDD